MTLVRFVNTVGLVALVLLPARALRAGEESGAQQSDVERREAEMFGTESENEPADDESSDEQRSDDQRSDDEQDASDDERRSDDKENASDDAEASDTDRREAEMFGGGPEETGSDDEEDADQEGDTPGGSTDDGDLEGRFESRLAAENDSLQLGGTYFGRLQSTIQEEGRFDDMPVGQPNIADLYLDARPASRVRFYTRGRLFFDPTVEEGDTGRFGSQRRQLTLDLDQLWLKFDIDRTVYVSIGRQQARWGVGRFWHPNDFLFAQKRAPLAIFDERTGVDIIEFHVPVESLGWNFYAVGQVDGAGSWSEFGAAGRAEFLVGQTEFAASASYRTDQPVRLGADVSSGVGRFDLRGAFSAMYGVEEPFYRGDLELETLGNPNPANWVVPEEYSRDDEWIYRALAGAEVGFRVFTDDTLYVGGEYFYNGAGYDDEELYPWLLFNDAFRPFYVGRHYAGLYAALPSPGEWDDSSFTASTLANLSDRSYLSRLDYRHTVLTRLQFYTYASLFYGTRGEFNFRLELPEISGPNAPDELEDGLTVPATRAQVGLGFQLEF